MTAASAPAARATERRRRIVQTAAASAVAKALSVITILITVPLTLNYLGPERYGMWMTISAFVAMMSIADLGLGAGLMNAVSAAHGRDDRTALRVHVSSAFYLLAGIAILILAILAVAYAFTPWAALFNARSDEARTVAGPAFAVMVACLAVSLPAGVVQRVQMGLQEGFKASLWQCAGSTLALVGVVAAVAVRADLPWLVLAFSGGPVVAAALNSMVYFSGRARNLAPSHKAVSLSSARWILRTGLVFFGLQIVVALAFASDNIIIAHKMGAEAVAEYAVPQRLFALVSMALVLVLSPLWPAYGEALARGDRDWASGALWRSLLLAGGFSLVASTVLVLAAPQLIPLWVGEAVQPAMLLLVGLGVWKVIEAVCNALALYLNGAGRVSLQLAAGALGVAIGLPLKIVLVGVIGVAGVVWGQIASYLFICIPILAIYMLRKPV